ncbi:MAG: HlyD family type I secretion periplasmic adaptor subunit [Magnetococcales bacterium]|nr:HlyD family type I secretion periplasmic adaptor subunit [Magnetococcales bacterium]
MSDTDTDTTTTKTIQLGNRQQRFLAQSMILEEGGLPLLIRATGLAVSLAVLTFLVWASFSVLDEVAPATGEVVTQHPVQNVQHLEGGIIQQILVKEGEIVSQGDPLVRLDPAPIVPELKQYQARRQALALQIERQRAFLEDRAPGFAAAAPEYARLAADQSLLLEVQRSHMLSSAEVIRRQISQKEVQIKELTSQLEPLSRRRDLLDEEQSIQEKGLARGLVSQLSVLAIKREKIRATEEMTRIRGAIAQARSELEESKSRLLDGDEQRRHDAQKELSANLAEQAQVDEQIARLENRVSRLLIIAPVRGIIQEMGANTLKGVIPPGGLVAKIVPLGETLHAEIRVTTRDIGHVRVGQPVTIKVLTYDYARYGTIAGELQSISPDAFMDDKHQPYFKGLVRLSVSHLGARAGVNEVLPGMTVQADIHTGSKTLMAYLLKPIYASINEAFRER